jgi:hypothetical protein
MAGLNPKVTGGGYLALDCAGCGGTRVRALALSDDGGGVSTLEYACDACGPGSVKLDPRTWGAITPPLRGPAARV